MNIQENMVIGGSSMNFLINKQNIRRFLEFFEEENNSINGRVKSIEIQKKKS